MSKIIIACCKDTSKQKTDASARQGSREARAVASRPVSRDLTLDELALPQKRQGAHGAASHGAQGQATTRRRAALKGTSTHHNTNTNVPHIFKD